MRKRFNPLALLGLVGLIGILGPLMGKESWLFWISWFGWFSFYNTPPDERFQKNLFKAGLPSFAITMLGLMVLFFVKDLGISQYLVDSSIELLFTIGFLSYVLGLKYFEVYGE